MYLNYNYLMIIYIIYNTLVIISKSKCFCSFKQ